MIIDLKNTFLFGKPIEITEYIVPPEEIDLNKDNNLCIKEIKVKSSIYSVNKDVILENLINVSFSAACDRCIKETFQTINFHLSRRVKISKEIEFLDDEINLTDHKLDLDALIKSDVLAKFPDIILCEETCRGICPKCYTNLNDHNCKCDRKIIDPRLKILENLL